MELLPVFGLFGGGAGASSHASSIKGSITKTITFVDRVVHCVAITTFGWFVIGVVVAVVGTYLFLARRKKQKFYRGVVANLQRLACDLLHLQSKSTAALRKMKKTIDSKNKHVKQMQTHLADAYLKKTMDQYVVSGMREPLLLMAKNRLAYSQQLCFVNQWIQFFLPLAR